MLYETALSAASINSNAPAALQQDTTKPQQATSALPISSPHESGSKVCQHDLSWAMNMANRVVIVTGFADIHALVVKAAIDRLGGESVVWNISNFVRYQNISWWYDAEKRGQLFVRDFRDHHNFVLKSSDFIWLRRPFINNLMLEDLHSGDRGFVAHEIWLAKRSLFSALDAHFVVNPLLSKLGADAKLLQLIVASQVGLKIPDTLVSNDPGDVKYFVSLHENCIVKYFHGQTWLLDNENDSTNKGHVLTNYTTKLNNEIITSVPPKSIQSSPAIYQKRLEKLYDLRLIVCGKSILAVRIDSQIDKSTVTDFRPGQGFLPLSEVNPR